MVVRRGKARSRSGASRTGFFSELVMSGLRSLLHRRKTFAKGLTLAAAVALFTVLALTSCAGVTHPCVTCKRELASDPFESAEEANWEEGDFSTEKAKREEERRRSGGARRDL